MTIKERRELWDRETKEVKDLIRNMLGWSGQMLLKELPKLIDAFDRLRHHSRIYRIVHWAEGQYELYTQIYEMYQTATNHWGMAFYSQPVGYTSATTKLIYALADYTKEQMEEALEY
jgi:hypothetical protein